MILMNTAYNIDCMQYMRSLPDKAFDLAVVDPPYGGGAPAQKRDSTEGEAIISATRTGGTWAGKYQSGTTGAEDIRDWDIAPPAEYFAELARVSKNQIIWDGNYFKLPPTRCFLVWRKPNISEDFSMAMAEYAWTSFNGNAKVFEMVPYGKKGEKRFHPTQKPIELYKWIFKLFAKPGFKILDTHLGSGSSRIAAYDAGLDFVGCEISKSYFDLQEKRFRKYSSQCSLFDEPEQIEFMEV